MTNERHACRKHSCWKLPYAAGEEPISQKPTCAFKRLIAKLRPRSRVDPVLEQLTQDAEDSETLSGPVTEFDTFRDTEALTILERSQLQSILSVPGEATVDAMELEEARDDATAPASIAQATVERLAERLAQRYNMGHTWDAQMIATQRLQLERLRAYYLNYSDIVPPPDFDSLGVTNPDPRGLSDWEDTSELTDPSPEAVLSFRDARRYAELETTLLPVLTPHYGEELPAEELPYEEPSSGGVAVSLQRSKSARTVLQRSKSARTAICRCSTYVWPKKATQPAVPLLPPTLENPCSEDIPIWYPELNDAKHQLCRSARGGQLPLRRANTDHRITRDLLARSPDLKTIYESSSKWTFSVSPSCSSLQETPATSRTSLTEKTLVDETAEHTRNSRLAADAVAHIQASLRSYRLANRINKKGGGINFGPGYTHAAYIEATRPRPPRPTVRAVNHKVLAAEQEQERQEQERKDEGKKPRKRRADSPYPWQPSLAEFKGMVRRASSHCTGRGRVSMDSQGPGKDQISDEPEPDDDEKHYDADSSA